MYDRGPLQTAFLQGGVRCYRGRAFAAHLEADGVRVEVAGRVAMGCAMNGDTVAGAGGA